MKPLLLLIAALAMYGFALAVAVFGQTSPRADQIRGLTASSPETAWCPGNPLKRVDAQTLEIGTAWSASSPCFAHFNLTPPASIDPISVSRFTAPARVTLKPGAWTDDLYIYLEAPIFSATVLTREQRIVVQTSSPANVTCTGCTVVSPPVGLRQFPALSMPVGLARVEAGALHPVLDPIINSHQLYIGAGMAVTVRRDGVGMWIELSRGPTHAEVLQAQIEELRRRQAP